MSDTTVILNPAAVDGFPRNVFCIGPFGDKVSFSSQQKRALNVVWALGKEEIVAAGTNVAVVGGGLAGLMACSALKGLGCYVTLYELNEDVLERQLSARHRTVHPSINAWPLIDYPRSTTDYPFFDWHVGECAEIISALKRDWDKHGDRYVVAFNNFSAVQKIEKDVGDPSRVKLLYENLNPETRSAIDAENFHTETPDVIVVTTGFGEETIFTSANVQSYWLPDTVNTVRKKKHEFKEIVVSGTGDGGLIDCSRLIHSNYNDGALALEIIGRLRHARHGPEYDTVYHSPSEVDIRKAEKRAQDMLIANASLNEISIQLEEYYKSIVSKFNVATRKILDDSLDSPQRVTLYGLTTTPFSVEASPINKIFLAHALIEYPELYVQAQISETAGKLYKTKNEVTIELQPDFYICRHGARPPIVDIIEGFDLTAFRGKQKAIADVLNIGGYTHLDFLEHIDFARECDPKKHKYADDRVSLAKSFAKTFYNQEPQPKINEETKRLDYLFVKDEGYLDSKYLTGGHDKDLFGVNIVLEEKPIEMLSAARQDTTND